MSSSRSSRLLLVLVAIVLSAGIAAGVTVSDGTPDDAEAGERVEVEYELTELYTDYDEWTLAASTELENVTWRFRLLDQSGDPIDTTSADGQEGDVDVAIDDGVARIVVQVDGEVPEVENFTYEPAPSFLVAEFEQTREGGSSEPIGSYETRHYTAESQEARDAIESAESAVESGASDQAEESLQSAIAAYEGENFELASQLAERAEREANQAEQAANQAQQRNQLLLYGGIAVVLLLVLLGVVYWFVNRDTASRL